MKVTVLAGGVGGARLLDGLAAVLAPAELTAIVNTGDDFEHWGLRICPDLDTVMYTLAGLGDEARGWGVVDDSFRALAMVERYGGEAWFQLGDRDLATHLVRTEALRGGECLSAVTARLCRALGVGPRILPMADAPRPTRIETRERGTLAFQEWLVKDRARSPVERVWFDGASVPAPGVIDALVAADVVVIAPSNPYVSIDPITSLDGVAAVLATKPVVGVSPIVGGRAVKGPLASMIEQLAGRPASAAAVVEHYGGGLDAMVVARGDAVPVPALETDIVMRDRADRARLAREVLGFAEAQR
jgi:LPPG:FO 2-phospho-L-lactate transferase